LKEEGNLQRGQIREWRRGRLTRLRVLVWGLWKKSQQEKIIKYALKEIIRRSYLLKWLKVLDGGQNLLPSPGVSVESRVRKPAAGQPRLKGKGGKPSRTPRLGWLDRTREKNGEGERAGWQSYPSRDKSQERGSVSTEDPNARDLVLQAGQIGFLYSLLIRGGRHRGKALAPVPRALSKRTQRSIEVVRISPAVNLGEGKKAILQLRFRLRKPKTS